MKKSGFIFWWVGFPAHSRPTSRRTVYTGLVTGDALARALIEGGYNQFFWKQSLGFLLREKQQNIRYNIYPAIINSNVDWQTLLAIFIRKSSINRVDWKIASFDWTTEIARFGTRSWPKINVYLPPPQTYFSVCPRTVFERGYRHQVRWIHHPCTHSWSCAI